MFYRRAYRRPLTHIHVTWTEDGIARIGHIDLTDDGLQNITRIGKFERLYGEKAEERLWDILWERNPEGTSGLAAVFAV